jgi:hypothetical protein
MNEQQITREMIAFNKSLLDNALKEFVAIHDQLGSMFAVIMENAGWLSDDGRKAIDGWISAYKNGHHDFKASTDKKFAAVMDYFEKKPGEGMRGDADRRSS